MTFDIERFIPCHCLTYEMLVSFESRYFFDILSLVTLASCGHCLWLKSREAFINKKFLVIYAKIFQVF